MTCAFKNDIRNLANFLANFGKFGLSLGPFIQSRKFMSLKFTGDLYVMTMKNDVKFDQKFMGQFKTDLRNLTIFDSSTQKSQ